MIGDAPEVFVGGQHCQVMAYTQLGQQCIDRAHLHTASAAMIPQLCRPDMIVAIRHQQRDRSKSIQNLIAAFGSGEALEQLLKHKAGRQQGLAAFNGVDECSDLPAWHW